jgi:hypothetical protein
LRGSAAIDVVVGAADDGPAGTARLYADIDPIVSLRPVSFVLTEINFGTSVAENGDNFGQAVAVGDFDGDGKDDVAIGAPFKDHGGNKAGVVYVAYGPLELGDQNDWDLLALDSFAGSSPAADDRFGTSLAAGDLDGDGDDDLVVGATGRGTGDRGALFLFRGSSGGLVATVGATEAALGGTVVDDDFLGEALAMGDVDGDGIAELAVGVPHRDVSGQLDAGRVYVTRIFDPAWLFKDSFESGDDLSWSDATN